MFSTIRSLLRYLFPPARLRDRLPLLPLTPSGKTGRYPLEYDEDLVFARQVLKAHGIARTDHDAQRIISRQGIPDRSGLHRMKRKRRKANRLIRAKDRFLKIL